MIKHHGNNNKQKQNIGLIAKNKQQDNTKPTRTWARTKPQRAKVENVPVYLPSSSKCPTLI